VPKVKPPGFLRPQSCNSPTDLTGLSIGTVSTTTLLNKYVIGENPFTGSYAALPTAGTVACCEPENTSSV